MTYLGAASSRTQDGSVTPGGEGRRRSPATGRFEAGPSGPVLKLPPSQRKHRSPITMPGYRRGVPAPDKGRRRPAEPLTYDEVLAILRATNLSTLGGCRDRALIVLLWRTGLRINEALDLEPRDLELEIPDPELPGLVRVRHGKGDQARVVGIDSHAIPHVRAWLDRRAAIPNLPDGAPVFCSFSQPFPGGRLGAPQVRSRLKVLASRAGVQKRVHPHGFRHTHATELYREGKPLAVVKEQLGHKHYSTTERYIAKLIPAEMLKRMKDRPVIEV